MMRKLMHTVAGVALAAVLTGCAGMTGPPAPHAPASPVDEMRCADPFGSTPDTAAKGTIPDGTEIVAVLQCDPDATETDDIGLWSGMRIERFEGDLSDFVAAVGGPNEPRWLGACTADLVIAPDLWALTSEGRYLHLSYPSTGCSQPKGEEVSAALAALEVTETSFERAALIESEVATAAGCATQAGVVVLAGAGDLAQTRVTDNTLTEDDEPRALSTQTIPDDTLVAADPADVEGLRACAYGPLPPFAGSPMLPAGNAGTFTGMRELAAGEARSVLTAAAAAPAAPECAQSASRFVVAHPVLTSGAPAPALVVELDGCRRLIDAAFRPLVASADLLALVSTAG